jgi:hypothetical protein
MKKIIQLLFAFAIAASSAHCQSVGANQIKKDGTSIKGNSSNQLEVDTTKMATKYYVGTVAGGTGTVTSIATGYGLSGGTITTTGTILTDSATLSSKYVRRADSTITYSTPSQTALKLNISDTATMLSHYAENAEVALKVNISDTASMLTNYVEQYELNALTKINYYSRTTATGTATTAEEVIASKLIPAGTIGNNDRIEIVCLWGGTSASGSTKSMKIRLHTSAAVGGTIYGTVTSSGSTWTFNAMGQIWEKGANNSQEGTIGASAAGGWGAAGSAVTTSSLSTASDMYVVFTTIKAVTGDVINLYSYDIIIHRAP